LAPGVGAGGAELAEGLLVDGALGPDAWPLGAALAVLPGLLVFGAGALGAGFGALAAGPAVPDSAPWARAAPTTSPPIESKAPRESHR
jgi:hypothetical protein